MLAVALEVRSTLPDGTRIWHIVRTGVPARAIALVSSFVGRHALVELTGSSFHDAADNAPACKEMHRT